MVIHHTGGRVLTIEVSTHADVGDMNVHCTAIFRKGSYKKVLSFFTDLLTEFHIILSLDLQYYGNRMLRKGSIVLNTIHTCSTLWHTCICWHSRALVFQRKVPVVR